MRSISDEDDDDDSNIIATLTILSSLSEQHRSSETAPNLVREAQTL